MIKEPDTPKYIRLKEFIKTGIQQGELKPGEKIPSENELASRFGISRHTVRQALGEMVNEGWLSRIQGSGTFVSRSLGQQKDRSRIIGVITTYLDDYIFPGIIRGMDNVLSRQGYSMILSHTDNKIEREAACLSGMMRKNVDGFIIEPTKSALPNPNTDLYEELERKGIPYIFINGFYPGHKGSYVVEDDEAGGRMAAKHLFDLGHERVGGIFKADDIQGHRRYSGVVRAHREYGRTVAEDAIAWYTTEDVDLVFNENGGGVLKKRFEGCTGIICYNDQVALRVIEILKPEGIRVPGDMSVVSFDDSELAAAGEVKLTTVAHPGPLLGEKAAAGLLEILKFSKSAVREVMKPELIVRSSTAVRTRF
jgi:GntR family transcriptional regulator of arabinose operon